MGTSNFHNTNASKVFAVLMDDEIDEFDAQDEFEMFKDDLLERLSQLPEFIEGRGIDSEELRSFPSTLLGSFERSKTIGGLEIAVCLVAVMRSGYYQGANLDYCIDMLVDGNSNDCLRDAYEDYSAYPGICFRHAEAAQKWAADTLATMRRELEQIYTEVSQPLTVLARFSNGETLYTK
jgi:hypothetical protein